MIGGVTGRGLPHLPGAPPPSRKQVLSFMSQSCFDGYEKSGVIHDDFIVVVLPI